MGKGRDCTIEEGFFGVVAGMGGLLFLDVGFLVVVIGLLAVVRLLVIGLLVEGFLLVGSLLELGLLVGTTVCADGGRRGRSLDAGHVGHSLEYTSWTEEGVIALKDDSRCSATFFRGWRIGKSAAPQRVCVAEYIGLGVVGLLLQIMECFCSLRGGLSGGYIVLRRRLARWGSIVSVARKL